MGSTENPSGPPAPPGPDGSPVRGNPFEEHPARAGLAILLVLVAATVAADLVLGAFLLPDRPGKRSYFYDHDLKRNYRGEMTYAGRRVPYRTNSLGFRDRTTREVPLDAGRRRILLLGDSFVEGVAIPWESTAAGLLQAALDPKGCDVLNAAVSSYSPKLHYLKLRRLLEDVGLKADEVIVFLDMSDVQDEIFYETYQPEGRNHPRLYAALEAVRERSYLVHKFNRYADKIARWHRKRLRKRGAPADDGPFHDNEQRIVFERPRWSTSPAVFEAWGRKGLELADRNMEKLLDLCRDRGIEVTLAVYPWPENIAAGAADTLPSDHWRAFAEKRGVGFIDYFPLFRGGGVPDNVLKGYFLPGDMHWNEAGHRLIADALLAYREAKASAPR